MAAGFFACAAPDLDIVYALAGPEAYLLNHRGPTHSLLLLPAWSFVVAWLLSKILREPGGWRALYAVSAMSLGLHVAFDLITSYGTQLLWPLSDWRPWLGTTFVIDLWFSAIILAGLAVSAFLRTSRLPAAAAFAILAGYVGFQAMERQKALAFGREYAASRGLSGASVTAFPRPVSPFNWTVMVSDEEVVRFSHVNLIRREAKRYQPGDGFIARVDSPYLPLEQAVWQTRRRFGETQQALIRDAWNAAPLAFFRWFAELPAFEKMNPGGSCIWFTDMRFFTPGRGDQSFLYGVCRAAPGETWRPAPPA